MYILKKLKKKVIFILVFVLVNISLFSHPHMWFTSKVQFVFSGSFLKGAFVTWTFDRFFSADIIQGYDINRDGFFSATEASSVYDNAFTYTQNFYYFIFIRQGTTRTTPEHISKSTFSVRQKNGIVSYRFFVDLSKFKGSDLFFACYDYTFFCDITYPENRPVSFVYTNGAVSPTYSIVENKNYPVYYNPRGAIGDNRIYYKWSQGLNTYYPREIHIKFNRTNNYAQ